MYGLVAVKRYAASFIFNVIAGIFSFLGRKVLIPLICPIYATFLFLKIRIKRTIPKIWLQRLFSRAFVPLSVAFVTLTFTAGNLLARDTRVEHAPSQSVIAALLGEKTEKVEKIKNFTIEENIASDFVYSPGEDIAVSLEVEDFDTLADLGAILPPTTSNTEESIRRTQITEYIVESGDTISTIAQKFGVSIATILWENNLTVRSFIRPGDKLKILPVTGLMHTIKSGDTLEKIAKKYKTDIEQIIQWNKLADDSSLKVGERLLVPEGRMPLPKAPAPRSPTLVRFVGKSSGTGYMLWPTPRRVINQYFTWRHYGLDIDCKYGDSIYASDDGLVTLAKWYGGYGLNIDIDHGNGIRTRYGHNSKLLVKPGDQVRRGDVIASCGSTGRSTGTHIHFEVHVGGKRQNPLSYLK